MSLKSEGRVEARKLRGFLKFPVRQEVGRLMARGLRFAAMEKAERGLKSGVTMERKVTPDCGCGCGGLLFVVFTSPTGEKHEVFM